MLTRILVLIFTASSTTPTPGTIFKSPTIHVQEREDFGGQRGMKIRTLTYHGINVGMNYLKPADPMDLGRPDRDFSRLATTYYHPRGPVGVALQRFNWFAGPLNTYHADARLPGSVVGLGAAGPFAQVAALWSEPPVAVLGLEAGTVASYARPTQTMHITERIPDMVKLSTKGQADEPIFHYVEDAKQRGAAVTIFEGEPHATFAKHGGEKFYHLIVVETYKEAVRTVHKDLLTKEGMKLLMDKLADDGVVCYHTSNRYYNVSAVVGSVADSLGYASLHGRDQAPGRQRPGHFTSEWVMVARRAESLKTLSKHVPEDYENNLRKVGIPFAPYWSKVADAKATRIWTDAGLNSFRGLYRSDPAVGDLRKRLYDLQEHLASQLKFARVEVYAAFRAIDSIMREVDRAVVAFKNR